MNFMVKIYVKSVTKCYSECNIMLHLLHFLH